MDNMAFSKIKKLCFNRKYFNSIKFMVHLLENQDNRKIILGEIAYVNPYLSAQILLTMCEDITEEQSYLLKILKERISEATTAYQRILIFMSLIELNQDKISEEYFQKCCELFDQRTCKFVMSNLRTEQQLKVIVLFLKYQQKNLIKWLFSLMKLGYDRACNEQLIETARAFVRYGMHGKAYDLLSIAGLEGQAYLLLNIDVEEIEKFIFQKIFNISTSEIELYLNVTYHLNKDNINDFSFWERIINDFNSIDCNMVSNENYINCPNYKNALNELLYSYVNNKILRARTIDKILTLKNHIAIYDGIDDIALNIKIVLLKELILEEPYYTIMPDEKIFLNYLQSERFDEYKSKYNYSVFTNRIKKFVKGAVNERFVGRTLLHKRIKNLGEAGIEVFLQNVRSYFNLCLKNYSNERALIKLYFNSPLKMVIYFEDFVKSLKQKFNSDEKTLRNFLGDYIFKGVVCNVKNGIAFVNSTTLLTKKLCIINTRKFWIKEGQSYHIIKKDDIIYFKFNYLTQSDSIHIHFPAKSVEALQEIKQYRTNKYY